MPHLYFDTCKRWISLDKTASSWVRAWPSRRTTSRNCHKRQCHNISISGTRDIISKGRCKVSEKWFRRFHPHQPRETLHSWEFPLHRVKVYIDLKQLKELCVGNFVRKAAMNYNCDINYLILYRPAEGPVLFMLKEKCLAWNTCRSWNKHYSFLQKI